ncbi:hypothetical protein CBR_g820 [Chara braunii]|uniref:Myb/SANT-like DNA-binding domain-containing protein n=1 Tax=Chara braunii TaxID=69332 RepID=A0A388KC96_CHABU|nr:hypothetical protein CBR_g820 [Chara braunii]|eukprot:GBG67692.1 hypothetical protein CBR_g820 [Chara braunii]
MYRSSVRSSGPQAEQGLLSHGDRWALDRGTVWGGEGLVNMGFEIFPRSNGPAISNFRRPPPYRHNKHVGQLHAEAAVLRPVSACRVRGMAVSVAMYGSFPKAARTSWGGWLLRLPNPTSALHQAKRCVGNAACQTRSRVPQPQSVFSRSAARLCEKVLPFIPPSLVGRPKEIVGDVVHAGSECWDEGFVSAVLSGRGGRGWQAGSAAPRSPAGDGDTEDDGEGGKQKKKSWSLEERLALAKYMREDDAMMAAVQPRQKHQRRSVRNDWVARRMKEDGYHRSAEDVGKKWADLQNKYREIHDKCGGSGKPSFWDMSAKDKKREGLTFLFEEELWDEMAWVQGKRSTMCDNTMESSALPGAHSGGSDNGTSPDTPQEDSESSRNSRRTERGKASAEEGCSSSRSGSRFSMEESTLTLCAGLGDAAGTLALANTKGAQQMATQIGAVASAMKDGNAVLQLLVEVMARRVGGGGGRREEGGDDMNPSSK